MSDRHLRPDLRKIRERFNASLELDGPRRRSQPADLSSSPLTGRVIFIVGSPRSGTTWLQQVAIVHPLLATGAESHIFCEGLEGLWELDRERKTRMGLRTWITRPDFIRLIRQLCDGIFGAALLAAPGTTHVLEKTPHHADGAAARMAEVYPDATYVHIIRDGYSSAASLRHLWNQQGLDRSLGDSAVVWRDGVESIRSALSSLRYAEIRYEDMAADPAGCLRTMFTLASLPWDEALVAAAVEHGRVRVNVERSDDRDGTSKWDGLDYTARAEIDAVASELLESLGYLRSEAAGPDPTSVRPQVRRRRLFSRDFEG